MVLDPGCENSVSIMNKHSTFLQNFSFSTKMPLNKFACLKNLRMLNAYLNFMSSVVN